MTLRSDGDSEGEGAGEGTGMGKAATQSQDSKTQDSRPKTQDPRRPLRETLKDSVQRASRGVVDWANQIGRSPHVLTLAAYLVDLISTFVQFGNALNQTLARLTSGSKVTEFILVMPEIEPFTAVPKHFGSPVPLTTAARLPPFPKATGQPGQPGQPVEHMADTYRVTIPMCL